MPVDEQTTVIDESLVVVTQPKEVEKRAEEEEEEEIIVIEKSHSGDVRKQKKKKVVKQKSEEEVEVEIEYIGGGKRIIKKKITANRPDLEEEIIDEEFTKSLQPFDNKSEHSMPLMIPSQFSETVHLRQTTEIQTDEPLPQSGVTLNLLPHSAISQEVVNTAEKESDTTDLKQVSVFAERSLDVIEPYQVSEPDVQMQPGKFDTIFKPDLSKASQSYSLRENVVTSEVHTDDGVRSIEEELTTTSQAQLTFNLQEATNVSETQISHKEASMDKYDVPKSVQANKTFVSQEGVEVFEITEGQSEDKYNPNLRPVPIRPKVNVSPSEPIIVSEVHAETKPDKYYPEQFVPTEVATESVISQRQVVTTELNAPELEGEFISGRLPPTQTAGVGITSGESIVVQEHSIHEKEGIFSDEFKPDTSKAEQNITLLESISVHMVDSQMPQNEFSASEVEHKKAGIDFVERESIVSTFTTATEREGVYIPGQLPEGKNANTSILCLETSDILATVVQESEGEFIPDTKPTAAIAERNVRPDEPVTVSEVHTADVPGVFSDILKYPTDEAQTEIVTQESKQITETFIQEREGLIADQETPASYKVQKTFDEQQQVHVFETHLVESEGILKSFEFPETHKGKSVPTHLLQTSIVEETQPQHLEGKIEDLKQENIVANVKHNTFEETVVEEAVIGESTLYYKPKDHPESQTAGMSVLEQESVSVIELQTQDKESGYKPKDLPDQYYATQDITSSQKVAIKSEVTSDLAVGLLEEEKPVPGQAKSDQTPLESVLVTESLYIEKEGKFVEDVFPDSQKAIVEINEGKRGIHVTQVMTNEFEEEYLKEEAPKPSSATTNICAQNVVVQSEHVTVVHADTLEEEEKITGRAKTWVEPSMELIVTDTTITDVETVLTEDIFPYTKTVTVDVIPEQELSVTEIITNEKEELINDLEIPTERNAVVDIIEKNVAMQEEIIPNTELGDYNRQSPVKDTAKPIQEILQHIVESQFNVAEKEGVYSAEVTPDSKTAEVLLIEQEQIAITVVQTEDKEKELSEAEKPEQFTAVRQVDTQTVAITAEVNPDDALESIMHKLPETVSAKSEQIPYQSLVTSEAVLPEKEGIYIDEAKPATQVATKDLELGESVSVITVTTAEHEKELAVGELPEMRKATCDLTGHIVAENTEIETDDAVTRLSRESPTKAVATSDHTLFESLINMEPSLAEKEGLFSESVLPESKTADVAFVEGMPVTVTEVVANSKETEYTAPEIAEEKHANPEIISQKVAEKSEIITEFGIGEIPYDKPETVCAKKDQLTFESLIQTEVLLREKESEFTDKIVLDLHNIKPAFEEMRSVTITEITSGSKESDYEVLQKPEQHTAQADITGQEIADKIEIVPMESLDTFTKETFTTVSAQHDQTPFESIIQIETTLAETEKAFTGELKPETKQADFSFEQAKGLNVTSVISNEQETELNVLEKPEGKIAQTDILGHTIASISEVQLQIATGDFNVEEKTTAQAVTDQVPYETIVQSETSILESENVLQELKAPESTKAKLDFIIDRSVMVSQVTLGDQEELYISHVMPEHKTVHTEISSGHEVAEQTQTFVSDALQDFNEQAPNFDTAKSDQNLLSSVIITESFVQDTEQDFIGKFYPVTKEPNITLEEGKKVHSVSEVFIQSKEGTIEAIELPSGRVASPVIFGYEVAQSSEVQPELSISSIIPAEFIKTSANIEHVPYQSIIQTEVDIKQTEETLNTELKYVTKSANLLLEENQSMSVMEVLTQDKEKDLPSLQQPETTTAEAKFTGKEVAQSSEVLADVNLSNLTIEKPTSVIANLEQETFVSIISCQTTAAETEEEFLEKFEPSTKKVQINFEEGQGVTVTEVQTVDKESDYQVSELPASKQAIPEFETKEVAQHFEITAQSSIADFSEKSLETTRANIGQVPFESLVQSEPIIRESETEFKDMLVLEKKMAETVLELDKSVNVTQVIHNELQGEFKPDEIQEKTATKHIPSQESVQHTQVESHLNIKYFDHSLPSGKFAQTTQGEFEGVMVSQNIIPEKEKEFESINEFVEKKADIAFTDIKGVTISETIPSDKEGTLVPQTKAIEFTAKSDIDAQEIAQKSFIISEYTTDELVETVPTTGKGRIEAVPLETVSVTESTVAETEGKFEETLKLNKTTANIQIDEQKSVTITQIISDESKTDYIGPDKPMQQKAEKNIIGIEELQQSEIVALQSLEEMPEDQKTEPKIARTGQFPYESIIQTEVSASELEHILKVTPIPSSVSASLGLQLDQEITVTEIIAQEQESEEIILGIAQEELAKPEVIQRQVALKTETLPDDTLGEFQETKVIGSTLKPAIPIPQHSVNVTQVVSEDMEEEFATHKKPQTQIAEKSFIENEEIQQSEVLALHTIQDISEMKTERKKARQEQTTFESVVQTEVSTNESEDVFNVPSTPSTTNAMVGLQTVQEISVIEVITQEKEGDTVIIGSAQQEVAKPDIIQRQVALKTETLTDDTIGDFAIDKFSSTTLKPSQPDEQHSVTVTQIISGDTQDEFMNPDKPQAHTAHRNIISNEEIHQSEVLTLHSIQGIAESKTERKTARKQRSTFESVIQTEVATVESEDVLNVSKLPSSVSATVGLEVDQGVQITEIIAQEHETEKVIAGVAQEELAKPEVVQRQVALKTETHLDDTVGQFDAEKIITTTLKPSQPDEHHSVSVIQVVSEDLEDELVSPDKPTHQKAARNVTSNEEISQMEVVTLQSTEEYQGVLKTEMKKAFKQQSTFESIIQTEVATQEIEDVLKVDSLPSTVNASIGLDLDQGVQITEIIPQEQETEKVVPGTASEVAKPDFVQRQVAMKTETQFTDTVTEFEGPGAVQPRQAQKNIIINEEVQQSMVLSLQNIEETNQEFRTETRKATKGLEVTQELSVIEVIAQEQESEKVIHGLAQEETAKPEMVQRQVALKTETLFDDTIEEFEADKIFSTSLKPTRPVTQHGLIVTELRSTGELESVLPEKVIPSARRASINLESQENLQVVEVYSHDKEGEYLPIPFTKECGTLVFSFLHLLSRIDTTNTINYILVA